MTDDEIKDAFINAEPLIFKEDFAHSRMMSIRIFTDIQALDPANLHDC